MLLPPVATKAFFRFLTQSRFDSRIIVVAEVLATTFESGKEIFRTQQRYLLFPNQTHWCCWLLVQPECWPIGAGPTVSTARTITLRRLMSDLLPGVFKRGPKLRIP